MSTYRVQIDRSLCSGFGSCAGMAPEIFELDGSGVAGTRVGETDDESVLDAAGSCPMGAISVFEIESGRQAA
jgi:ferredoxin